MYSNGFKPLVIVISFPTYIGSLKLKYDSVKNTKMGGLKSKLRRPKSSSRKEKDSNSVKRPSKKKTNLPESQSARKTVDPRLPFSNYRQIFSIRNAWKAVSRHMEDSAKETLIR